MPRTLQALSEIREALALQGAELARLTQQRRDTGEHDLLILRRLTELERLIAGGDLLVPPRFSRRRPLGQT